MRRRGTKLPHQYAGQAMRELAAQARELRDAPGFARNEKLHTPERALRMFVSAIHAAKCIVLPVNGEIYRENFGGGEVPSPEECESFQHLPAQIICLEYRWSYTGGNGSQAPRRVTVAIQDVHTQSGVALMSAFFDERTGRWELCPACLTIAYPLKIIRLPASGQELGSWVYNCVLRNLETGEFYPPTDPEAAVIGGEFCPDIGALVQCSHALRIGRAQLLQACEGQGGFTYHVLRSVSAGETPRRG